MNVLDLFGFDTSNVLNPSETVHRENERSNLLIVTRIVLRSFLQETVNLRHRMLETDTQQLDDLFMMLEKVLWHGFKASVQRTMIAIRSPDAELWSCIVRIANSHKDMNECVKCITQLDNITSAIARIRALLRLAIMQKKLADYFQHIQSSSLLKDNYEPWALLRHEECISLTGALMGLSVLDCNLLLDQDHLLQQPPSVDLASYIRMPTISFAEQNEHVNNDNSNDEKYLKTVLDQKNFLEERNRYLETNVLDLKKKIDELEHCKRQLGEQKVSLSDVSDDQQQILQSVTQQRDELLENMREKDDTIRVLKQQLSDIKKVNVDLYEKIRIMEHKFGNLEREFSTAKQHHNQEKEHMRVTIEALKSHNSNSNNSNNNNNNSNCENQIDDPSQLLKEELANKTEQYMSTLNILSQKQEELSIANDSLNKLKQLNWELNEKLKRMPFMEEELEELRTNLEYTSKKLNDYEKALEELGGHLSESKLQMVELKEELLPLTDAQWENDHDVDCCKGCNAQFTVSRRKHHCRNCGSIYCNVCSDARVKLPSSAKAVRVCLVCYHLLKSRQNTTTTTNNNNTNNSS